MLYFTLENAVVHNLDQVLNSLLEEPSVCFRMSFMLQLIVMQSDQQILKFGAAFLLKFAYFGHCCLSGNPVISQIIPHLGALFVLNLLLFDFIMNVHELNVLGLALLLEVFVLMLEVR